MYGHVPTSYYLIIVQCISSSKHMIINHTQPCVHDTKKKLGPFLVLLISVLIITSLDIVNVIFFVPHRYI